ncbi:heterokaryon incompatibility protein-domain-containing protein [Dendryphion nanum]|uniref:Heterokaryon incompatibility protein-domain-containing protein n=1 Tax=Dendryphion nanum TaxID=256645 RepID=A0A9P9IYZ3_9PLEO|nr:heterokaryon incompatibility protein-domain-containing protein [Dendryphion nanum]
MPGQMYMALLPQFSRLSHCEFVQIMEEDIDTSNFHAHVVSDQAKHTLLADRHPWTHSSTHTIDAETLLQDLDRLAPGVAKNFIPKPQAKDALVFRIINELDMGLDQGYGFDHGYGYSGAAFCQETSYIAMSYCWQRSKREIKEVQHGSLGDLPFGWVKTVEKFPLPTSGAMFQAVLRERQDANEGVWFDQVCINQEDEAEKAIAIGAMDSIYKNARAVIVALDDIVIPDDEAYFIRQYIEQFASSDLTLNQQPNRGLNPPFMEQQPCLRSFADRILNSIWFERAWCAHEMRLAQNHIFIVPCLSSDGGGSHTFIRFTGTFFLHMLVLANEVNQHFPPQQVTLIRSLLRLFSVRALEEHYVSIAAHSPGTKLPIIPKSTSFVQTIAEIFRMKASGNPRLPEYLRRLDANRDRTSIALNISDYPLALQPANPFQRPCIEDECLRQLLLVGVAARDPVALCTTGPPLQLHDGSISWLCRPSLLDVPSRTRPSSLAPFEINSTTNPISQASDGRAEFVQLDLVFLDLPHRTQPNPHFPSLIQRARSFIDLCLAYNIPSTPTWTSWQTQPNHPRAAAMKNIFVQTLACCLECGPHWLLDVSTSFQGTATPSSVPSPTLPTHIVETIFNPNLIIQNYILTPEGQHAFSLLLTFLGSLIAAGIPWGSNATERTHGPMIVHSPRNTAPSTATSSPHSLYSQPAYPSPTPSGKALIFAPFAHSKTLLIAVPAAVKAPEYESLSRAWILTPTSQFTGSPRIGGGGGSTTVNWTLQGKGCVFGDEGFKLGVSGVGDAGVRCHRVFGPGM